MSSHSHIITDRPRAADQLPHFPFNNFGEMLRAYDESILDLEVDPGTALHWSERHRVYESIGARLGAAVLIAIPYAVGIALVAVAVQTMWWTVLLGLPLVVFGHVIFHPGHKMTHKVVRDITATCVFIGLVVGLAGLWWQLVIIALAMILVGYARWMIYRHALNRLKQAALRHEDLFCALWMNDIVEIKFYSGSSYGVSGTKHSAPLEQEIT